MSGPLHECPGKCGTKVLPAMLACRACWGRLPRHLRQAVAYAYPKRRTQPRLHRAALTEALAWYRDNPARCPGCGSTDKAVRQLVSCGLPCDYEWHGDE